MRVKTISIGYERKFNLGNYSSAALECTLWADLDDGEDSVQAIARLQALARESVKQEYGRLEKKTQPNGGAA